MISPIRSQLLLVPRPVGSTPSRVISMGEGWGECCAFIPSAPAGSCAAHLFAADIHLVSQQPEWMGVVVPSKFQTACALSSPVLSAGPAESAVGTWIQESDAG